MRKLIALTAFAFALALPAVAAAEPPGGGGYGWQPGATKAAEVGAQCGSGAGSGSFGAFGNYGNLYTESGEQIHDFGHVYEGDSNGKPGANGKQTGINNSGVCGHRP